MRFATVLHLPQDISVDSKEENVTRALERLGLLPFSDISVKALGASELNILTMALELVSEPLGEFSFNGLEAFYLCSKYESLYSLCQPVACQRYARRGPS